MESTTNHRPNLHNLPESIGEFIGWRAWRIVQREGFAFLQSIGSGGKQYSMLWTPGRMMEATCSRSGHDPEHQTPAEGCSCGFYSAASREQLSRMAYPKYTNREIRVFGAVALAGKVIPGTQGWRAQLCWPVEIYVPSEHTRLVFALRKTYPQAKVSIGRIAYPTDVATKRR